jgi:outer membrane protein assembly factor BamB
MRFTRRSILMMTPAALQAADWTSFRGTRAAGVSDGAPLPVECDLASRKNVRWTVDVPGLGHSSPVVSGNQLYLTAAIPQRDTGPFSPVGGIDSASDRGVSHRFVVIAMNLRTGKTEWTRTAYDGPPRIQRHVRASHANATPAVDRGHLAVFFGSEGLYLYKPDGALLWKKDLGVLSVGYKGRPEVEWGWSSSPVLSGSTVVVQCDTHHADFVAAFDVNTGNELWRTPREEYPTWSTPTIVDTPRGARVITASGRFTRAHDLKTGKELWRYADETEVRVPTPIVAHGLIFIAGGYPQGRPFYALDPDGKQVWRNEKGGPYVPTPIVYGDYFYIAGDTGILGCYEAKTGKEVYRERLGPGTVAISASPVAGDGKLFLPTHEGDMYAVTAGPKFELRGKMAFGEPLMATPAIAGGILLVRGIRRLHALENRAA